MPNFSRLKILQDFIYTEEISINDFIAKGYIRQVISETLDAAEFSSIMDALEHQDRIIKRSSPPITWRLIDREKALKELSAENNKMELPENQTKQKKHNMFSAWANDSIIMLAISLSGIIFFSGYYFGELKADYKNNRLENENKSSKDSLFLITPSFYKTEAVPDNDTSSNQNKKHK